MDWFRFGHVVQRTKACQTDLDIQRGFLFVFACKSVDFITCLFNSDEDKPTVMLTMSVTF